MNFPSDIDSLSEILDHLFAASNHDGEDGITFTTSLDGMALYVTKESGKVEIIIANDK